MAEGYHHYSIDIWAYCLMPKNIHLVVIPETEDAIRRGIGEAHRLYIRLINFRQG